MTGLRVGVSAALGLMVTLGLVFLMFKLIDSGSKELDEGDIIKIPDFLHVERELTENAKKPTLKNPMSRKHRHLKSQKIRLILRFQIML